MNSGRANTARLLAAGCNYASQLLRIVPDFLAVVQEVCANNFRFLAEGSLKHVILHPDLKGSVGRIERGLLFTDGTFVENDVI
jgi:hypothetical protein